MKNRIALSLFIALFAWVNVSQAAVTLQRTRVLINPGEKEGVLVVDAPVGAAALVQSWLSTNVEEDDAQIPFTVTPALSVVKAGSSQNIVVIYQGAGAAQDKETLLYLNVQDSVAMAPGMENKNVLSSSFLQVVKVFYRPGSLSNQDPLDAPLALKWSLKEKNNRKVVLQLENPTPFHVVFDGVTILGLQGKTQQKMLLANNATLEMVAPQSKVEVILDIKPDIGTASLQQLYFITINDFGMREVFVAQINGDKITGVERVLLNKSRPGEASPAVPQSEAPAGKGPAAQPIGGEKQGPDAKEKEEASSVSLAHLTTG